MEVWVRWKDKDLTHSTGQVHQVPVEIEIIIPRATSCLGWKFLGQERARKISWKRRLVTFLRSRGFFVNQMTAEVDIMPITTSISTLCTGANLEKRSLMASLVCSSGPGSNPWTISLKRSLEW